MLKSISIQNFRSIRQLDVELGQLNIIYGANGVGKSNLYKALFLLYNAALGQLPQTLVKEGGFPQMMWAGEMGKRDKTKGARRMVLAVDTDHFEYELQLGYPDLAPDSATFFKYDPIVKEESIWLSSYKRRPSAQIMLRKNQTVFMKNIHGEKTAYTASLYENESIFGQLADPHLYPEVSQMREIFKQWRFYHEFAVWSGSAVRQPQIGFRAPVLADDGHNLAAAFQTIIEIGDDDLLRQVLAQAFPDSDFYVEVQQGFFHLLMQRDKILRPLSANEFSDGTLRFLCLAVALLSPRPPQFIALNEPENSLHPDMLPALARLIAEASRYSQIWLTTHSRLLIECLQSTHHECRLFEMQLEQGQTIIQPQF